MRTGSDAAGERHRRQADAHAVAAGGTADDEPGQCQLIGGGHRCQRRQRDLELVGPVLGMELLDPDTGRRCRGVDVADEGLVLEHTGKAVLRPQRRRQPATVGIDQQELDFMADHRLDAGFGERGFDPAERPAAACGYGCAVLLEEGGRAPRPTRRR